MMVYVVMYMIHDSDGLYTKCLGTFTNKNVADRFMRITAQKNWDEWYKDCDGEYEFRTYDKCVTITNGEYYDWDLYDTKEILYRLYEQEVDEKPFLLVND